MPKFLLLLHMLLCVQIQDFDNDNLNWQVEKLKKKISTTSEDHFTMNYLLDMNTLSLFLKMTLTNLTYLSLPLKNQTPPSPKCYFSVSFLSLSNPWIFHANHAKTHKIQMSSASIFFNSDPPIFNIFWVLSANLHTRGSIEVLDNDDWH